MHVPQWTRFHNNIAWADPPKFGYFGARFSGPFMGCLPPPPFQKGGCSLASCKQAIGYCYYKQWGLRHYTLNQYLRVLFTLVYLFTKYMSREEYIYYVCIN